jgi:hypothetical protein
LHEAQGSQNLRLIETPVDAKGTRLYLGSGTYNRLPGGAAGQAPGSSPVFGSNFTFADLMPEQPQDFTYQRERDQVLDRVLHHVVRATPANAGIARQTGYDERLIYLRKDNLFISRIYYQDQAGRTLRRQSFRDPQADEAGSWQARMRLMEDLRDGEQSLLKVERRVHSADYVPASLFAASQVQP